MSPYTAGGTVADIFRTGAAARDAVERLRTAGFSDVRVSERSGETSETHVPPEDGLTEIDFAESLCRAGFDATDARILAGEIARGRVLVTVAAAERGADALAVLRGDSVTAPALHPAAPVGVTPVGVTPVDVAPASVAPGSVAESNPPAGVPEPRVVQLRAEELQIATETQTSEARVRREIVTEQRTITVPVRHEELVIERDGADPVRIPLNDSDQPGLP